MTLSSVQNHQRHIRVKGNNGQGTRVKKDDLLVSVYEDENGKLDEMIVRLPASYHTNDEYCIVDIFIDSVRQMTIMPSEKPDADTIALRIRDDAKRHPYHYITITQDMLSFSINRELSGPRKNKTGKKTGYYWLACKKWKFNGDGLTFDLPPSLIIK